MEIITNSELTSVKHSHRIEELEHQYCRMHEK